MAAEEEGSPVDLYVYDLTRGLAALLSPSILGRQVAGVWHTAVVVFGREYFYGSGGITHCEPVSRITTSFVRDRDRQRALAATSYRIPRTVTRITRANATSTVSEYSPYSCY
ncbi:PPPDE peptidase domain-containing protein 2 [Papilio machaon]|uniref:PPPDE peptidase domain-containing protein 2 n=1 Tax=Papilio machaon TaxID=76193 RepID=A0A194R4D0_PAPMA|nr:PPPDE peptidase domain-containing protein 2 [Papilio machaon]